MDFAGFGLATSIAVFVVAAALIWLAGTRLAQLADWVSARFGLGQAVIGVFLLAGFTSLPDIAISFSAALQGDAPLAVNNLLGGIALQVALLALADLCVRERALTSVVPDPVVMLQGAICVCVLGVIAAAVLAPDAGLLGAGIWTWSVFAACIYGIRKVAEAGPRKPWIATGLEQETRATDERPVRSAAAGVAQIVLSGAVILAAGYCVARVGENIAQQTRLGSSFVGVAVLALATSLPEASTVLAAVRRGRYTMAISDILGTNIFNVALLLGVDLLAGGDPVLTRTGNFASLSALLGLVMTSLFLIGLIERRDRTVARLGVDSLAVLVVYVGGLGGLYLLRG